MGGGAPLLCPGATGTRARRNGPCSPVRDMTLAPFPMRLLPLLALALALAVEAAPRRVVVATGDDCQEAALNSQTLAFYTVLLTRPGESVLSVSEFSERLFPQPSGGFEDLRRQLEAARGQFYEGQHAKATQATEEVLRQVERLPPGEERWRLFVDGQLLQALNHRAQGRVKESDAAFRQVLRLAPQHALDPNHFTPSTRQAFEKLRRELTRGPKVRLSVKSTVSLSEVYLDGLLVGETPLELQLPAGTYGLSLKKGAALSFPRQLTLQGEEVPLLVDLAYEGSVTATPFPCLFSPESDEQLPLYAMRLGGTLGVEEVILVRLESVGAGPQYLAANVIHVEGGRKGRGAGFPTQGLEPRPEDLTALVAYITTGQPQPRLVELAPGGALPPQPPSLLPPGQEATASARPEARQPASLHPLRLTSYAALGAGVLAAGAAGVVRLSAGKDLEELTPRLTANGRVSAEDTRGQQLLTSLVRKSHLMTGLLIGSGVAVAGGGTLFFLAPATTPPPVSVGVSVEDGGLSANLSGTF